MPIYGCPLRALALRDQLSDETPKVLAALLEVFVLVVARAGRAEQDDVTRARLCRRVLHGAVEGAVVVGAVTDRRGEIGCRRTDQGDRANVDADCGRARGEPLAFEVAARNQRHRA